MKKILLFLGIYKKSHKTFFKWLRKVPAVRARIEKEMKSLQDSYRKDVEERLKSVNCVSVLPKDGMSNEELLEEVRKQLTLGN